MAALNRPRLKEGSTGDYGSESNISTTDELAGISALARGAVEAMIIQTVQRYIEPIMVPILTPLIRQVVEEQIGLIKQEVLAIMKENLASNASTPANNASTSGPKQLKLQFRNKISPQVYTGKPLLGENETTIEIALVDAITEQIVNTGPESMAKLEIVGFRVGDNDTSDDNWTFEDFQKRILNEKKGKRVLQGNTCLQLKEGVCLVNKISFTHSSEYTKKGWYRLGAGVVDDALMNVVEVAKTEAFHMKDGRHVTYYENHPHPSLSDKVCHLQQIRYKGNRFKNLIKAGVITVKDLLILLYTDPKQLELILKVKASSKIWSDIIKNAQSSNGMFLFLDPSNKHKVGVVLNVKLQLKGLIVEPQQYIPVDQLSDKQKVDNQDMVNVASQHLKMLHFFEDETSLKVYLQSGANSSLPSPNLSLENSPGITDVPDNLNNSNLQMNQSTNHVPMVISHSERGKETVPFDDEMIYSTNYYQEHISFHSPNLKGPNELNFGTATERRAHNAAESGTCGVINTLSPEDSHELDSILNYFSTIHFESPNHECHYSPPKSDTDVLVVAAHTLSVCTIAQTRWTKVSKLLRRNSVRERISHLQGIQPLKKQRCC